MGIRGIYTRVRVECKESVFQNRAGWQFGLVTWLSREFQPRGNWMARLDFLSYNATAGTTVQLLCMLGTCVTSGSLQAASYPRDPVASPCFFAQSWAFLHTLSYTTFSWFQLNTGLLIAKIQENLARNKANKMVDKIQPYICQYGQKTHVQE